MLKDLLAEHSINVDNNNIEIEIPDDFEENSEVDFDKNGFTITCKVDDLTRKVQYDLSERTITVSFESDIYSGAEVYTLDGKIMKVIN